MNRKVDDFFRGRFSINDKYEAVRYRINDRISYDIKFLKNYINSNSMVLDLGCGTGIIEEHLVNHVKGITAVDKYEEFILRGIKSPKIKYIVSDVAEYLDDQKYNLIMLFGVAIYLSDSECSRLYENVIKMLDKDGFFIIKNQFGVNEEVVVDKYSEELKSEYYAVYRHLPVAVSSLEEYFTVNIVDIYPSFVNRWGNTHEYALVCTPKKDLR